MKTIDVLLEEEVLSTMLKREDFARMGVRGLVQEDFSAMSEHMRPRAYTKLIFKYLQENVKAGGSAHFSTIQRAILADPAIPEKHQNNYTILLDRLHVEPVQSETPSYLQQIINQLRLVTRRRTAEDTAIRIYERLKEDDILGFEDICRKQVKNQGRFRGEKDPVIIDYGQDYEERLAESRSAIHHNIIVTGVDFIDENFGGITKGEVHLILSRTGGGKSVTMQHITCNVALLGGKVLYFTKEDTERQVAYRMDAHVSGVEHPRFHRHELTTEDFELWARGVRRIPENSVRIVRMPPHFTVDLCEEVYLQQLNVGFEPDLVVVDHVNIMRPSQAGARSEHDTIMRIMEELKGFTLEYSFGSLSAAQLRPQSYNDADPTEEAIGGSKRGISANVDGLYAMVMTDEMRAMNQARIKVMKGRGAGIIRETYNVEPNFNQIAISDNWRVGRRFYGEHNDSGELEADD